MSSCHTEEFRGTMFCICNLISNNNEWGFQWVREGTLGLSQKACIEFSEILSPLIWFSVSLIVFSVFFVTNTLKFLFRKKKDKIYYDQKKKKKSQKHHWANSLDILSKEKHRGLIVSKLRSRNNLVLYNNINLPLWIEVLVHLFFVPVPIWLLLSKHPQ